PFVVPPVLIEPDRDEAKLLLRCFEVDRPRHVQQLQTVWKSSLAAGLAAPSGVGTGSAAILTDATFRLALTNPLPPGREPGANIAFTPLMRLALTFGQIQMSVMGESSPSWLFLAIRAARRAIHDHPDDALAWQLLGDAYWALQRQTSERISVANWPVLRV